MDDPSQPKVYGLSEKDREWIAWLIKQEVQRVTSTMSRPADTTVSSQEQMAPEVYVVYVDESIPGITEEASLGTGDDQVKTVDANVYRFADWNEPPELIEVDIQRAVYNLTKRRTWPNQYHVALRDKFGTWFLLNNERFIIKGKLDEALQPGGRAIMSCWEWNQAYTGTGTSDGEEADSDVNEEVHDWLLSQGTFISAGKKVIAGWINGRWYVLAAECED